MNIDFYNDVRFIDMGDLPTGFAPYDFKTLYARPFVVHDMVLLAQGTVKTGSKAGHVIRTVHGAVSCDVMDLTDGDFEYVLAWLRLHSYPKAPNQVHWTCKKPIVVEEQNEMNVVSEARDWSNRELILHGYKRKVCDNRNVEIVHNVRMDVHSLQDNDLTIPYNDIDFPRVRTLQDYLMLAKESPEDAYEARIARWLRKGNTLEEKIANLRKASMSVYDRILECQTRFYHGISESMTLKCRVCKNTVPYKTSPNIATFFADNTEQNILDMQYSLLSDLHMQPDYNMPAKAFLYYYSSLMKDKQQEQERLNLLKAMRKKG